ncbi:MAG: DUF2877 domain-containing protein, partial [Candidatus Limnocylindria bacterium]
VIEQPRQRRVRSLDHRARIVATPVLEWAEGRRSGRVLGVATGSVHLAFEPGVVVVTNATRPLMPNGVAIAIDKPDPSLGGVVAHGQRAILDPTGLSAGGLYVHWDDAVAAWEPAITSGRWDCSSVVARAVGVLERLGMARPDSGSPARLTVDVDVPGFAMGDGAVPMVIDALLAALRRRDADRAAFAAAALCGRGEGLTPVGDDVLAAALVTLAAMAPSVGLSSTECRRLTVALAGPALAGPALAGRTTAMSHTLLRLAAQGRTLEPVISVLDLEDQHDWPPALERLLGIGHTTGSTYAYSIGATAWSLAS